MKNSDTKRLQSLAEKKNNYKKQKSAIQFALSNVEESKSNKITFNDDGVISNDFEANTYFVNPKKQKLNLFDGEENELNSNDLQKQFENNKSEKLLELQSKFAHDSRFVLDERFQDDNEKNDACEEKSIGDDADLDTEKKKQLSILSSITGKTIREKDYATQKTAIKGMLRFDPTKADHSKFEVEKPQKIKEKKNKKGIKEVVEVPENTVSQKTFYKVTGNLKESLEQHNGFSLLNMFGEPTDDIESNVGMEYETKKKKHIGPVSNPFKYDSSDSEDETPQKNNSKTEETPQVLKPLTLGKEAFFFTQDDPRLQEGLSFIFKQHTNKEDVSYSNKRRELKQIVRSKIRNNKRNNRPFKVKLGGRKNITKRKSFKK